MESQPQNPEFRINLENFHPWFCDFPGGVPTPSHPSPLWVHACAMDILGIS